MGDINFTIAKDVDLNKVVNLDIDKDVDVNVNNDDILATAEADAEAFGERALAETDAFTYVSSEGEVIPPIPVVVDVDALGNTTLTEQIIDPDNLIEVTDTPYILPNDITVNFDTPDDTGIPDIDDLNWTGGLIGNEDLGGLSDQPLPVIDLFAANDKNLSYVSDPDQTPQVTQIGEQVIITAEYELTGDWTVDFGTKTVTAPDGSTATDSLLMTVPEGTRYLVEFLDEDGDGTIDAKEYEFEAFEPDENANWVFGGVESPVDTYVQDGEEIFDIGFGDWAFEAIGTIPIHGSVTGDGEAFSYAESTAALDLNGDGGITPPVETEL